MFLYIGNRKFDTLGKVMIYNKEECIIVENIKSTDSPPHLSHYKVKARVIAIRLVCFFSKMLLVRFTQSRRPMVKISRGGAISEKNPFLPLLGAVHILRYHWRGREGVSQNITLTYPR